MLDVNQTEIVLNNCYRESSLSTVSTNPHLLHYDIIEISFENIHFYLVKTFFLIGSVLDHGLRTPNEGINQR